MIVCHCKGITDRDIRRAAGDHRPTRREIGSSCGAGTGCGGCAATIREILRDLPESTRSVSLRPKV